MRVLLLERATFPSLPAVSSPAIYAGAMALLDEIGAPEQAYARGTPPIRRWITEARDDFRVVNPVPDYLGRDYGYAVDRARFDEALWRHALRFPTVWGIEGMSVVDLLWEEGRVCGVRARSTGGEEHCFRARCVVGADGRYSLVARKVGAQPYAVRADLPTTLYYAYWKNTRPYDEGGASIHLYGPGYGYGYLLMDSADGTLGAVIEGQSALLEPGPEGAAALYLRFLQRHPRVWRRFQGAEMLGQVRGIRRVGNLYRTAGGPGWALVGDAVHQKDPLDGQGIYDALFSAKALANALIAWQQGGQPWPTALAGYEAMLLAETLPMYQVTLERVRRDIYTRYPAWLWRTLLRWLVTDPTYKWHLGRLIVRGIDPARWLPPSLIIGALLRGAQGDLIRFLTKHPNPDAPLLLEN